MKRFALSLAIIVSSMVSPFASAAVANALDFQYNVPITVQPSEDINSFTAEPVTSIEETQHNNQDLVAYVAQEREPLNIGGVEVSEAEHNRSPNGALVRKQYTNINNKDVFSKTCSVTAIDTLYVIGVGHCVTYGSGVLKKAGDFGVVFNRTNIPKLITEDEVIRVKNIIPHEQYSNPLYLMNDIVILELEQPLTDIDFAVLADQSIMDFLYLLTDNGFTVPLETIGWGMTRVSTAPNSNGSYTLEHPDNLQRVTLPLVSKTVCETGMFASNGNLCAGFKSAPIATCKGDSGSNLSVNLMTPDGERKLAIGMVSFTYYLCSELTSYSVYTEISFYVDWIKKHVPNARFINVTDLDFNNFSLAK